MLKSDLINRLVRELPHLRRPEVSAVSKRFSPLFSKRSPKANESN